MIGKITESVSSAKTSIQDTLSKSTKTFYDKLNVTDNYTHFSNKVSDNFEKFSKQYPGVTESLISTKLTFNNGTEYIRSIPASVGGTVYSYVPTIHLVDVDEEIIKPRTQPNDNLAEKVIPLNDERAELVNHILDLYSYNQTKESFKYFEEDVVYEDQLIYIKGLSNLKAQFQGVTKLLKSTTVDYKVLENTLTVLRISLNQKYDLPFFKKAFILNSIIVLDFDEEGKKIIKHTDLLLGKHPVYGGEVFRKGAGKIVSTFVKVPEQESQ